jgi:hypothetical protein
MTTVGVARTCPLFTKMVDCLEPLSSSDVLTLRDEHGVGAVGRYMETLKAAERDTLFAANMPILLLSEAPSGLLSVELGHQIAASMLALAEGLEAPKGLHLMADFEAQEGDAEGYDNALTGDVAAGGFIPLAYGGAGESLTGHQEFELPNVHLYWRGGSIGIPEPDCGFAIWQIPPLDQILTGVGVPVDVSVTGADARGRRPILWYPS